MPELMETIVSQANPRERIEEAISEAAEVFVSPSYQAWARSKARTASDAAAMAEEIWPGITRQESEVLYKTWLDEGRRWMLLPDIEKRAAAGAAVAARENAV